MYNQLGYILLYCMYNLHNNYSEALLARRIHVEMNALISERQLQTNELLVQPLLRKCRCRDQANARCWARTVLALGTKRPRLSVYQQNALSNMKIQINDKINKIKCILTVSSDSRTGMEQLSEPPATSGIVEPVPSWLGRNGEFGRVL